MTFLDWMELEKNGDGDLMDLCVHLEDAEDVEKLAEYIWKARQPEIDELRSQLKKAHYEYEQLRLAVDAVIPDRCKPL